MRVLRAVCCLWGLAVLVLPCAVLGQPARGDGAAPVAQGAAIQRGRALFASACSFCHGANAGGAQGPALTASPFFTAPDQSRPLSDFLKVGRPTLGMPPFPELQAADVAALRAFVRSVASSGPAAPPMDAKAILVGDPAAGRAFFAGAGQCSQCHSITADLKGIGARYDPVTLQGRIVNPRVVGVPLSADRSPPRVQVSFPDGRVISGELRQINDFFVTLIDAQGVRRTIARDNDVPAVQVHDPAEAHRQRMLQWQDRDLWNVTAFLAGLK